MRINSNFKDYYDGLQSLDDDKETVLNRFPKIVTMPFKTYEKIGISLYENECIIGFAGTLYPFKEIIKDINSSKPNDLKQRILCFDAEQYLATRLKSNWEKRDCAWIRRYHQSAINTTKDFFDVDNIYKYKRDLFDIFGPIFILDNSSTDSSSIGRLQARPDLQISTNINLSKYGFAKVLPPHLAYNNLKIWVNNQARPEKPIPEMPNDIKIEQAGFDLKKSFRHRK